MAIINTAQKSLEFELRDFDKKKLTKGIMVFTSYQLIQRFFRALLYLTLFLGLAIGAVFIPVLHFVLVPAFSIMAALSAFLMFFDKEKIISFEGTCPYCEMQTHLSGSKDSIEQRCACKHCLQLIFISKAK